MKEDDIFLLYTAYIRCATKRTSIFSRCLQKPLEIFSDVGRKIAFTKLKNIAKADVSKLTLKDLRCVRIVSNTAGQFSPNFDGRNYAEFHSVHELQHKYLCSQLHNTCLQIQVFNEFRVDFEEHFSLEKYRQWMPISLKQAVSNIDPSERLKWCVNLLLFYHFEEECSAFLSCALSFCLQTVDLAECAYTPEAWEIFSAFTSLIINFKCNAALLIKTLRVFCVTEEIKNELVKQPTLLKEVLNRVQIDRIILSDVFRRNPNCSIINSVDFSFIEELDSFVSLIRFGATSDCSEEGFRLLVDRMPFQVPENCENLTDNRNTLFRCFQVIYLYMNNWINEPEKVLHLLWASIPDPYLTIEDMDMIQCFKETSGNARDVENVEKLIYGAWDWYHATITEGPNLSNNSPRYLKHLARCSARKYLSSLSLLPNGVKSCDCFPQQIKNYLLLKRSLKVC